MRRKHNHWTSLIAMLLLAVLLVLICTGCSATTTAETAETTGRFTVEQMIGDSIDGPGVYLITDTETGAQYVYIRDGYTGGVAVLQPAETVEE